MDTTIEIVPLSISEIPTHGGIPGRVVLELWKRSKKVELDYWGPKRVSCDTCCGLGWIPPTGPVAPEARWPTRCTLCGGKGDISLHSIATAIGEDPGALYRLTELRVRPRTASRLLDKLLTFSTPPSTGQEGGAGLTPV